MTNTHLTTLFLFLFANLTLLAQNTQNQDSTTSSPNFQWSKTTQYENHFGEQSDHAFSEHHNWKTNALVIIKDDTIIFERYENGFQQETPHRIWSITKAISSALIGIRISQGALSLDQPIAQDYPQINHSNAMDIKLKHLLQMSSGLEWNEGYEANPLKSNVIRMLYTLAGKDMATYTANQEILYPPGKVFHYSSGETNLAMGVLKKTFEDQSSYDHYPWQVLFNPLGIDDATWEQDRSGNFVGSSYLFMSALSLAKIARLYLNKGQWLGKEIINQSYIEKSLSKSKSSCQSIQKAQSTQYTYGYYWWLNQDCPNRSRAYPLLSDNVFFGLGHHGQTLAIFPDHNAIAIRFGADKKGSFDRKTWFELISKSLNSLKSNLDSSANEERQQ